MLKAPVSLILLLAAGCIGIEPVAPDACRAGLTYAGGSLRSAIPDHQLLLAEGLRTGTKPPGKQELDRAFGEAFKHSKAVTMTASLHQAGHQPWSQSRTEEPGQLHYWASVGKMVTAAAILQLETQKKLTLSDPVSAYIDGIPHGDLITLDMLLTHTSGLFSVNEAPERQGSQAPLDLKSTLDVINRHPPYACPGTHWRYSNSGYILLGAVIEHVTGEPYHIAAHRLVLSRSSARTIKMLTPNDTLDDVIPLAPGQNEIVYSPAGVYAAGTVVADATGMATFLEDLLSGRIVEPDKVKDMVTRLYPMFDEGFWYGRGVMAMDVPGKTGTTLWLGHVGGIPGGSAIVAYVPDYQAVVAVALTGTGSATASANLLLKSIR